MSNLVNSVVFTKQVKQDILNRFKQNSIKFSNLADKMMQEQIEAMNIPDSGFLSLKSFQKSEINLTKNTIAIFVFQTRGVDYAEFVKNGKGTNTRYGERDYLKASAKAFLNYLETNTIKYRKAKGSPNKGERIYAKRATS